MFGFSLEPRLILGHPIHPREQELFAQYGGMPGFLRALRGLGVTHIELRCISPDTDPALALRCAEMVWDAGFRITVHGALPARIGPFSEVYPSMLALLAAAKQHQDGVTLTVHAYSSKTEDRTETYAADTRRILLLWQEQARELGFRLALENNRYKGAFDPGHSCEGVLSMLEGTDPEVVGTCFDMGHFYNNAVKVHGQSDRTPPREFLARAFHTHIHALNDRGTHAPFTPGNELPLERYLSLLTAEGYSGVYNLELTFDRFYDLVFRNAVHDSVCALRQGHYAVTPRFDRARTAVRHHSDGVYAERIRRMHADLADPADPRPRFHMLAPTAMLFRAGQLRFAVDPAIRSREARLASREALRALFADIPYVFITHDHVDHMDVSLLSMLADLPVTLYYPACSRDDLLARSSFPASQVVRVREGDVIELPGLRMRAYRGRHFQTDGTGVPSLMYVAEFEGLRLFLPNDVRDYGLDGFPEIEPPDAMFANVWLGRGQAQAPSAAAYEEFCDYVAAFAPRHVYLGHLYECLRDSDDIWTFEHAGRVADGLCARMPEVTAEPLRTFGCYRLPDAAQRK